MLNSDSWLLPYPNFPVLTSLHRGAPPVHPARGFILGELVVQFDLDRRYY
jgi:hypothetical protein